MPKKYDILVVEDHPIFRDAVVSILKYEPITGNLYKAKDGLDCITILERNHVDLVLLDINMPSINGIQALQRIRMKNSDLKVVMLTQYSDQSMIRNAKSLGANGYLLKSTTQKFLLQAIEDLMSGKTTFVCYEADMDTSYYDKAGRQMLTERESEVLCLICKQFTTQQIAIDLSLSVHTVNNHRKAIMRKTGAENLAGMIRWGVQNGFS